MTAPALPAVHGSHIAELGRRAALPYRGTPHPLARARHAAAPIVRSRPALVDELLDASRRTLVAPLLYGLLIGGFLMFGLGVLAGMVS